MTTTAAPAPLQAPAGIPPEEFRARRGKALDRIGPGACAVVQGAGPVRGFEAFRQTNEFHWLTGIEAPQAYLWLDGGSRAATLFLPRRDERLERSDGPMLTADDAAEARAQSGVGEVRPLEELEGTLRGAKVLFAPHSPAEGRAASRDILLRSQKTAERDPWHGLAPRERGFLERIREGRELRDLSPILDEFRLIKSPVELALLRRAGQLSALAVREAMRCTRPGLREYQLEAVARYLFRLHGASGEGYCAIVPSGPRIWHAHYFRNDGLLEDGELVLMDYAPDYRYYTSDIGRMWPVNGRYSPLQRELLGFMTRYHQALLRRIRPGRLASEILAETAEEMAGLIASTRFSKLAYEQAARRTLKFAGHLSHPVGMAVHDVGEYRDRPLQEGMVFAVDPQLWVDEEKLYVRVEDTVAVTADGVEVLTAGAPLELEAIEAEVGVGGLVQQFPPAF
ncbi:MAG: aminopeptidase P N-terminal domain-containing protein [Planctomycetes bacterium]|nr:aminopeptidase P N-terminal domain-containing protein [Planctomycetota bacterium]